MPRAKYESDDGDIKPIRVSAETIAAAGAQPGGAINDFDYVKVSKGNREFGQRPRGVRLSRNLGTAAVPNLRYKFLPVFTQSEWGSANFAIGATVTVGGVAWEVVSKVPEDN